MQALRRHLMPRNLLVDTDAGTDDLLAITLLCGLGCALRQAASSRSCLLPDVSYL
jgi:hypothetical protein